MGGCGVKEKLISLFGSFGETIYNLSYVAMAIMPILALPLRWWWKVALFASIYIPLLGGFIIYILEFVSLAIILRSTQNWFAVVYYIQFVLFLVFAFAPFLMAVFSAVTSRLQK